MTDGHMMMSVLRRGCTSGHRTANGWDGGKNKDRDRPGCVCVPAETYVSAAKEREPLGREKSR